MQIQTVGQDDVGLAPQQLLGLKAGDLADRGENSAGVRRRPLDCEARINVAIPRLLIPGLMNGKWCRTRAVAGQIPPQQRRAS